MTKPSHDNASKYTVLNLKKNLDSILAANTLFTNDVKAFKFFEFVVRSLTRIITDELKLIKTEKSSSGVQMLPELLDSVWEDVISPILGWFRAWKLTLLGFEKKKKYSTIVEFRKLRCKLRRTFKLFHKFYYGIIEFLVTNNDISRQIPEKLLRLLNLKRFVGFSNAENIDDDNVAILVIILHQCLLILGKLHFQQSYLETIKTTASYEKSVRYLKYAVLVLPAYGTSYHELASIEFCSKNFHRAIYLLLRGTLTRIPNLKSNKEFHSFFSNKKDKRRLLFNVKLQEVLDNEKDDLTAGLLKLQYYFLALFGYYFQRENWFREEDPNILFNGVEIVHMRRHLFLAIEKDLNAIDIVFDSVIILMGGFELMLKGSSGKIVAINYVSLRDLKSEHIMYLEFCFDYFTEVINAKVRKCWRQEMDKFQYLAIIRIIECWIKSNQPVLQFAHRNKAFCFQLAEFVNDIISLYPNEPQLFSNFKPQRNYFFEEDILLKEFCCVKFVLSDFDDSLIFKNNNKDIINQISGFVGPEYLRDKNSENMLRLRCVMNASNRFLLKNRCGIRWNKISGKYMINNDPVES
ncbi:hypothetical protein KAFR_0H01820 [Kazachstania africana CBS 2517]|uniref:Uncharacterized protein n=1 Tax=Kazachstania africana (strain ATCC 22294 / BCRC 22015 / CBS 2517 / CECT 1963 / NBRC 1671 / NRRL Y-8276) TaxID=1071382 RepID=H2AZ36_KAZAF|nr:hypothetical protein KAFR_0H01820 [Kazachstania africana CBS 2517]CCF59592.1 hypothetical protein KAFR_0H01820 [Kazachstania africana CBS 2517]